jgi:hypothetical protein
VGRYRKIDTRVWNDAKFNALSERGKLVFFFLLTHPNLTMLGAMRATIPGLTAELGMPAEAFAKAFGEVLSKGMVKHDQSASFFWLPNFLKYNRPESPNVVKSWPDAFDLLPGCQLKGQLFQHLKAFAEGLTKGFQEAFAKGMPNQEQEQEQDKTYTSNSDESDTQLELVSDLPTKAQRLEGALNTVWQYFIAGSGHHPKTYKFTDRRRTCGLRRLEECIAVAAEPKLENAIALFKLAIDGLVMNPWNRGENPQRVEYLDWIDHLCKSTEEFGKRLKAADKFGAETQA